MKTVSDLANDAAQVVLPDDYNEAWKEVEKVAAGRNRNDIPLDDPFWSYEQAFRSKFHYKKD